MLDFALLKTTGTLTPRLGRLSLAGRRSVLTPGFIGSTSRGVVPHISQDNFQKSLGLDGVYVALEDFIEKHPQKTPPIFHLDAPASIRKFTSLPEDTLLVLGARRNPPIPSPTANTNTEISLLTSVGYRSLSCEYYAAAARKLQPDIVVGLADIPLGQEVVGAKRKDKMSDRTETWTRDIIAKQKSLGEGEHRFNIFAPILPIERDLQSWYLEHLVDDMVSKISGVAIYDAYLLDDLPEELHHLPRLSFHAPASPHELLRHISLGMDLFTIPFISSATDAGIALDFVFPPPQKPNGGSRQTLGIDMWHTEQALSVTPLGENCTCYACTKHHRAYIQHLLSAKEMLGWVLIQIHNHAVLSTFFTSVRASIEAGTFDADAAAFEAFYEPQLPEKTGQGPRVRGYQFGSEEHAKAEKKNPKAFRKLDEEIPLKVAHGQQPNKKPAMKDVIDDEALVGLVGMEDANGAMQMEDLKLEDDRTAEVKA
ncbi:tRNA-guanine transglycosylase family protein [Lentithecium fluviatile CBS 122367]|uniref:Queuine tRNA-ribosyltransferase accessory subunit 2 n=1 Tax=Lentithecium fluviatile CBS 122367 TaxID=1168545 RepID=A0A6G1J4K2_9PLEO|nr:tRNA-guanine transglycosylase family protein [Lentithecium fluviatile CBS 122367]